MSLFSYTTLLWCLPAVLGNPTPHYGSHNPLPDVELPVLTVAQLSDVPTWLENVVVRANGDLLATQYTPTPVLYTVRNPVSKRAELEAIYEFPTVAKVLGIAETQPDIFTVIGGNATANATGYAGSFSAWEVAFAKDTTRVRKITDLPDALFPNGFAAVPTAKSVVLIGDSELGLLLRLDTKTGKYETIADRPEFKSQVDRANNTVALGINGVKISDGYLYFTNSNLVHVYRVPITRNGYIAHNGNAKIELYADLNRLTVFLDDFEIGHDGTLWATTNSDNTIVRVSAKSRAIQVVAGAKDQLTVAGGTGAAFGRTFKDKHILYVSTSGGLAEPVNGTITEPAKIAGIDTRRWG